MISNKYISHNKDGKVFQNQIDWNSISDEAGECPLFEMKLKEVTLEKAKENLIKFNFKFKNTAEQKLSALFYIDECCQLSVDSIR